jgi:hypothetical protein
MQVSIQSNRLSVQIQGIIDERVVFCLEKDWVKINCLNPGENWIVANATTPTGTTEESLKICRVSLKCHKVAHQFDEGHVDVGAVILLGNDNFVV